ncbi:hypothetical protein D3C86_832220 [compost metagenome]
MASASVFSFLSVANSALITSRLVLSALITPERSHITIFSFFAPKETYRREQEIAAAPAPFTTILTLSIFFFCNSHAFNNAAAEIMAVPCWSSCITGIFISSFKRRSISKHSGALISSKLIPPKVGSNAFTILTKSSTFVVSNSRSKTSISANILNNSPLPSITGLPASGPILPSPKTAVPLLITATRLPLAVYL